MNFTHTSFRTLFFSLNSMIIWNMIFGRQWRIAFPQERPISKSEEADMYGDEWDKAPTHRPAPSLYL